MNRPGHNTDLTEKYGRITIAGLPYRKSDGSTQPRTFVDGICECGTKKAYRLESLKCGRILSCGCLQEENRTKHGMAGTRLYYVHNAMIQRCNNPNDRAYHNYGARGIKVSPEFMDKKFFFNWATANDWEDGKGLEIDRKNNAGDYSPDNCHFVTKSENNKNKRTNNRIMVYGVFRLAKEWSNISSTPSGTIFNRVQLGWCCKPCVFGARTDELKREHETETIELLSSGKWTYDICDRKAAHDAIRLANPHDATATLVQRNGDKWTFDVAEWETAVASMPFMTTQQPV